MEKSSLKLLYNSKLYKAAKYNQQNAGFTLLEIIVIVVIVGILGAIAAPGWLAFVNRQQLNKANDGVYAILQETQRQAKKSKLSYSVSFRKNNQNQVEFAIYPTKKDDGKNDVSFTDIKTWRTLGDYTGMQLGPLLLGTNMSSENTTSNSMSYNLAAPTKITFDYMATLTVPKANSGGNVNSSLEPHGLRIVLATPKSGNPTQADLKRCVIIKTLLGGMRTAKDNECDI